MLDERSVDDLLGLLRQAETALHQPQFRRDAAQVQALLHESFREFGRSGISFDRAAIVNLLASEEPGDRVLSQDFAVTALSANAALLTYKTAQVADDGQLHRHTLRASVWLRTAGEWKLIFHQGTPTEAFDATAA